MREVDTSGMIFKFSRPLMVCEIKEIEEWVSSQSFKGRVVMDHHFQGIGGKLYAGLHFDHLDDLMLFKLTWGG